MTSRRQFLHYTAAVTGAALTGPAAFASTAAPDTLSGRLYKTLKLGMVQVGGSLTDKFQAARAAGFHGVEVSTPNLNIKATKEAIEASGLPVDGSVISSHWNVRHTDPSPQVRAKALDALKRSLEDVHAIGGNTVLLVAGHGKDGSQDEIWKRCIDNVSQAIPLAAELGIYIAVENVWNRFMYDHEGDQTQTADQYVKFVDELNSPWVGLQFDIGNHWKYGSMGDWIRQLGRRIVKLDLKGFSRAKDSFTKIGEGDLDWADVRRALLEINFSGWAAAEVGGGDMNRLKEISANMDTVFGLTQS